MRYLNWDILIFPVDSKVPLQEFRTACHAVLDHDRIPGEREGSGSVAAPQARQLAVLSCFVPSQAEGSPFKISVHSWEPPDLSPAQTKAFEQGKLVCFEIRAYVDGVFSASDVVEVKPHGENVVWPRVLEQSLLLDRTGEPEGCLLWPRFHEEMLTAPHWNAAEDLRRVKVIISEGLGIHHEGAVVAFSRTKSLVAFSFQHAPLGVLENCRIAWPNKGMWQQGLSNIYRNTPGALPELRGLHSRSFHSLSGSKSIDSDAMSIDPFSAGQMAPVPLSGPYLQYQQPQLVDWSVSHPSLPHDPFIDARQVVRQRRSEQSDVSMPDWPGCHVLTANSRQRTCGAPKHDVIFHRSQSESSLNLPANASSGVKELDGTSTVNKSITSVLPLTSNIQRFRTYLDNNLSDFQFSKQTRPSEESNMFLEPRLMENCPEIPLESRPRECLKYLNFRFSGDRESPSTAPQSPFNTQIDEIDAPATTKTKGKIGIECRLSDAVLSGEFLSRGGESATTPEGKRKRPQSMGTNKLRSTRRSASLTLLNPMLPAPKSAKPVRLVDATDCQFDPPVLQSKLDIKIGEQSSDELKTV